MKDIFLDSILDSVKLLPFLLLTFLIIEFFEHKMSKHAKETLTKSEKLGPIIGSTVGIVPQCGFSVAATNLYVTKIITLGTLIAVYLATSDEMLPILLSEQVELSIIIKFLGVKWLVGLLFGILVDFVFQKREVSYDICEHDHCHCKEGHILKSSIKHTLQTIMFIFITTLIINILFVYLGEDHLKNLFLKDSPFAPFLASLIGLIPNCGASIMLTELFLSDIITASTCMAGLLTGSGVALIVLFKSNKNTFENVKIVLLLYGIGVCTGLFLTMIGF